MYIKPIKAFFRKFNSNAKTCYTLLACLYAKTPFLKLVLGTNEFDGIINYILLLE